jgi:hypothetical protein
MPYLLFYYYLVWDGFLFIYYYYGTVFNLYILDNLEIIFYLSYIYYISVILMKMEELIIIIHLII